MLELRRSWERGRASLNPMRNGLVQALAEHPLLLLSINDYNPNTILLLNINKAITIEISNWCLLILNPLHFSPIFAHKYNWHKYSPFIPYNLTHINCPRSSLDRPYNQPFIWFYLNLNSLALFEPNAILYCLQIYICFLIVTHQI